MKTIPDGRSDLQELADDINHEVDAAEVIADPQVALTALINSCRLWAERCRTIVFNADAEAVEANRWASDEHTWVSGLLLGELMRCHVSAVPVVDEAGNYTPTLDVTLPAGGLNKVVRVRVLQP